MPHAHEKVGRIIARPQAILESYLVEGEEVLYDDAPSFNAFIINQIPLVLLVVAITIGLVWWSSEGGSSTLTGWLLIGLGVLTLYLWFKRFRQLYTRYVLTSFRVLRISGFTRRENAWIPWAKVTDIRYESSLMGRFFGYATVAIDSANELSGLKELTNLRDPNRFEEQMVRVVKAKQGDVKLTRVGDEVQAQSARSHVDDVVARLADLLAQGPVMITLESTAGKEGQATHAQLLVDDFSGSDGLSEDDATLFD